MGRPSRVAHQSDQALRRMTARHRFEHFARSARGDAGTDVELTVDVVEPLFASIDEPDLLLRYRAADAHFAWHVEMSIDDFGPDQELGDGHQLFAVDDPAERAFRA